MPSRTHQYRLYTEDDRHRAGRNRIAIQRTRRSVAPEESNKLSSPSAAEATKSPCYDRQAVALKDRVSDFFYEQIHYVCSPRLVSRLSWLERTASSVNCRQGDVKKDNLFKTACLVETVMVCWMLQIWYTLALLFCELVHVGWEMGFLLRVEQAKEAL